MASGRTRQISLTSDRLHVRTLEDGRLLRGFRFSVEDLNVLERAIDLAKSGRLQAAGRIAMKLKSLKADIEVDGGRGTVVFRMRFPDGGFCSEVRLEGTEISALATAIKQFKSYTAHAEEDLNVD
jgi:hypothetical protein